MDNNMNQYLQNRVKTDYTLDKIGIDPYNFVEAAFKYTSDAIKEKASEIVGTDETDK